LVGYRRILFDWGSLIVILCIVNGRILFDYWLFLIVILCVLDDTFLSGGRNTVWNIFPETGPSRSDIQQGSLGDCWFLSALSVLANYPELVKRVLVTTTCSEEGVYAVRLCYAGQWRLLMLDDWLPCDQHGYGVFAQPSQHGSLWVRIRESDLDPQPETRTRTPNPEP
jgi:hypothetical protein